jgi:hypothetical protein
MQNQHEHFVFSCEHAFNESKHEMKTHCAFASCIHVCMYAEQDASAVYSCAFYAFYAWWILFSAICARLQHTMRARGKHNRVLQAAGSWLGLAWQSSWISGMYKSSCARPGYETQHICWQFRLGGTAGTGTRAWTVPCQ